MINRLKLQKDLESIRQQSPLVHNITNYVAMNFTANTLLAMGASPVMAHAEEEMEEMTRIAGALMINIGTLDEQWIRGMLKAGKAMNQRGGMTVLDPVGVGATTYRTQTAWQIIKECHPTIIRGNASEIMALVHADIHSKGVDSTFQSTDALASAQELAKRTESIVVVSGAIDYITDGTRTEQLSNGSPMQTLVTAMGCTASSVVAAFAAVNPDPFEASLHAMALMGVVGEEAAKTAVGPGTLLTQFVDLMYTITPEQLAEKVRQ